MRLLILSLVVLVALTASRVAAQTEHRTFATPEDAVRALADAVKIGSLEELLRIFGPEGREIASASDPSTALHNRQIFVVAMKEQWKLEDAPEGRKTLVIGYEEWPFPVSLVKTPSGWQFDTAAGKEEILARRVGQNELMAIQAAAAYVTAQRRYAQTGHDGQQPGAYATKFMSTSGKQDGLYWPTKRGEKRSPLGDLVADAAFDGRQAGAAAGQPSPFHGYYFKILTAQGAAAPGGARNYVVNGRMTGGFALVAWPAEYDRTGVMTFMVGQDGVVYEKDLGLETAEAARKITSFNPDGSWRTVE